MSAVCVILKITTRMPRPEEQYEEKCSAQNISVALVLLAPHNVFPILV